MFSSGIFLQFFAFPYLNFKMAILIQISAEVGIEGQGLFDRDGIVADNPLMLLNSSDLFLNLIID
jgi:hypothetical protein